MHLPGSIRKSWVQPFLWAIALLAFFHFGGCGGDSTSEPQNDAPVACFTVAPDTVEVSSAFIVDASCSSDDQDSLSILQVRWDWENDGAWDTDVSTVKTASHQFETPGLRTIRLRVVDSGDKSNECTALVTVSEDTTPPPPEGMALVPAGPFTMGSDPGEGDSNEEPERQVTLPAFYIDLREVTNVEYAEALNWAITHGEASWTDTTVTHVEASWIIYLAYSEPACRVDRSGSSFVVEQGYEEHPIVEITWYGAAYYCNWRSEREGFTSCYYWSSGTHDLACNEGASGYRLPAESEWEKAARGSEDERTYPWGEEAPDCSRVNFAPEPSVEFCMEGTAPVGSYGTGVSPYGLLDMAGNVWEWCNNLFDPSNPLNLSRSIRGGSLSSGAVSIRCANRHYAVWVTHKGDRGFRTMRRP